MPPSRLYRSIIVFGVSLGAGTLISATGCDIYYRRLEHRIDAPRTIADAEVEPDAQIEWDAWHGTIDDAPNADAGGR